MSEGLATVTDRGAAESPERLADKIKFLLAIYPALMPSMLHVGIGPHVRPQQWRPVLERMIADGDVVKEERGFVTPIGQYRTFTFLRLSDEALDSEMARIKKADVLATGGK